MEPDPSKHRRRLALAQCAPTLGDVEANLELHLELTEQALAESANLVVFPELGLTGYFLKDLVTEVAMSLEDKRLRPLLDLSKQVDIITCLGETESYEELIRGSLKPNVMLNVVMRPSAPRRKSDEFAERGASFSVTCCWAK